MQVQNERRRSGATPNGCNAESVQRGKKSASASGSVEPGWAGRVSAVSLSHHPKKKRRTTLNDDVITVLRPLETCASGHHIDDVLPWFAGRERIRSNPVNIPGEDFFTCASLTHGDSPEFHSLEGRWCTRLPQRRYAGIRLGSLRIVERSQPLTLEH